MRLHKKSYSSRSQRNSSASLAQSSADRSAVELQPCGKTLLLLRHGQTALNAQHRFVGSTDLPLSSFGRRQLTGAARWLRIYSPERCFCSPMRRCVETARAVLSGSELQPEILPDLCEIDFGEWEKLTFEEIQTANQEEITRWSSFDPSFRFPGGERLEHFISRVRRAAVQISSAPQKTIVVITHGGVIRLLICHFLGLPVPLEKHR